MTSSDLEQLYSHINEKIGNIKKTLPLRDCGQEPASKTTLNKIGVEVIVVNEHLNKLESEVQYQEQTNNSFKELCESLEEGYKGEQHCKEKIPSHFPHVTVIQSNDKESDLNPEEPPIVKFNDVIKEINKAVISKYKMLHQSKKSMSSVARNLYHRFIDEETKDTKGHYFIVEVDIKEFSALKVDKSFHVMLNIL
ncbi:spindle and kinetochore-associated protein 1-like [Choloepus didactylus]|uniref:spindle and kinetochore-associated protein 1-like n=1 Tax=Choloepus didactylus TaxID=27675 RepID=UPI00189FF433|nr:spindle and kinetochore-associated protein 1-like [Choloepus didactylus]